MKNRNYSWIILGIVLSAIFWIFESLTHTYIFQQGPFIENLLYIDSHELWMRLIVLIIIFSLSLVINIFFNRQEMSQNQVKHLNQVLKSIQDINRLITNEKDLNNLIQGITNNLIKNRGYNNAWIASFNKDTITIKAHSKLGEKANLLKSHLEENLKLNCIELALENPGVHLIKNPSESCITCPISQKYSRLSAFTVRLEHNKNQLGILTVSIPQNYADSQEEQKLFNEMANDISYALFSLELEKNHQYIENALKKEELKYQKLVENMKEGLILEDSVGLIKYVNPRSCELLKFQEEELIGKHWTEIVPEEDRGRLIKESKKRVLGIGSSYESNLLTKDNKKIPAIVSANPFFSEEGEFQGVLSVFTDISEQKLLEERRKKFIETTSHELRTPLTSIKGFLEVLKRYNSDIEQQKYCFRIINKNINRLERLIDDVSDISMVERGTLHYEMQEVDFNYYINTEVQKYSILLNGQFNFEPESNDYHTILLIDKGRISQVLDNIIDNAIKHTLTENRQITLKSKISENREKIRIIVRDNGIGIAPENLEKIFDEFVSIETNYSLGGAGVGLYLCKVIVKNHKGKIWARSDGINSGASFIFELPIYRIEN